MKDIASVKRGEAVTRTLQVVEKREKGYKRIIMRAIARAVEGTRRMSRVAMTLVKSPRVKK